MSSLLITAVLVGIGWQSIGTIEDCHHACSLLLGGAMATKSLAQSAETEFYVLAEAANQSLFSAYAGDRAGSAESFNRFNSGVQSLAVALDGVLQALNADPLVDKSIISGLASLAADAKNTLNNEYAPLIRKLADSQNYGGDAAGIAADFTQAAAVSRKIGGDLDGVIQGITDSGNAIYAGYVVFLLGIILKLKILMVIAAVVSIALVVFLAFIIKKPFQKMMKILGEIAAEWDMTKRFEVGGKDEAGSLAEFCNRTFQKIKVLLLTIKQMTVSLSSTGMDLTFQMQQTASSVTEIAAAIQNMKEQVNVQAEKVQKSSDGMERIISHVNTLNEHIEEQSKSVSQSSAAIEQMLANIHSVAETLSRNSDHVQELAEASEKGRRDLETVSADIKEIARESEGLLEINAVMENISSQTNLLSMNAAIEAAHSGEAGRGFAVVAGEIRKLAESSAAQSKTIGAVLKKIKTSIDSITRSTNVVIEGFETITTRVETVSSQESGVRAAMEEQESGSHCILEEVGRLRNITDLVSTSSSSIAREGSEIKRESETLDRITTEIRHGMNEMAEGSALIGSAANKVSEISADNRRNIEVLVKEIAKFKVE